MTSEDIFANETNLAPLAGEKGVAIALSSSGDRLIGGTSTGLAVFGVSSPALSLPAFLTEQISRLSSQIGFSAPRLVRLRLGGLRPVTVRAQRARLSDGTGVLVLAALDAVIPRRTTLAEPAVPVPPAAKASKTATITEIPAQSKTFAPVDSVLSPQLPFEPEVEQVPEAVAPVAHVEEPATEVAAEVAEPAAEVAAASEAVDPSEVDGDAPDLDIAPAEPAKEPLADDAPLEQAPVAAPVELPLPPVAEAAPPAAKRPLRFVWQAGEDGLLTLLSPEFATAVDADLSRLLGRSWSDLAVSLGFDPEGKLERALSRRDTWSGVTIEWPLPENRFAPIDLAGLPVYDRERVFQGFRGFGVCREPQQRPIVVQAPRPVAADEPTVVPDTAHDTEDAPAAEPAERTGQDNNVSTVEQSEGTSVVPFPDVKENGRPPLSNSERHAFREIARTLGSRTPAGKSATTTHLPLTRGRVTPRPQAAQPVALRAPTAETSPAVTTATASPAPGAQASVAGEEDRRLLDALPVAVLLHRGGVPIYANRAFHDLTGYATLDELARNGVESLFDGTVDGAISGVQLTRADGIVLSVECHLKQVDWEDDPASLLTFRPIEKEIGRAHV